MNKRDKEILITGAAGLVGTAMMKELRELGYRLRLLDLNKPRDAMTSERIFVGSVVDKVLVAEACDGVEGILHLAGCTTDAPMPAQIEGNIVGASNIFEAAKQQGIERVVFASSHHVVGYYPRRRRIGTDVLLRPDSRYGLTKAFGEQLGAFYADKYGLRSLAIRIGYAGDEPVDRRRLSVWISWRDLAQLVDIGFSHPDLRYAVVYGVSKNDRSFFDNEAAFQLGYQPKDNAEHFAAKVLEQTAAEPLNQIGTHVIGGHFANSEYIDPIDRIYEW